MGSWSSDSSIKYQIGHCIDNIMLIGPSEQVIATMLDFGLIGNAYVHQRMGNESKQDSRPSTSMKCFVVL